MESYIRCDSCNYENVYTLPDNGGSVKLICERCKADLGTVYNHPDSESFVSLWEVCSKIVENTNPDQYQQIAKRIGDLVSKKQLQYGDSFGKSSNILEVLYPNGIPVNQYTDALAIVRVIDKLFRISTGNQGDEDAWSDICGYSLLSVAKNMRNK